jgi:hypothetical protein
MLDPPNIGTHSYGVAIASHISPFFLKPNPAPSQTPNGIPQSQTIGKAKPSAAKRKAKKTPN